MALNRLLQGIFEALPRRGPSLRALLSLFFRLPATQTLDWEALMAPFFPHIDLRHLRPADLIRLPLQLLWLLLVKPRSAPTPTTPRTPGDSRLRRLAGRVGAACGDRLDRLWLAGGTRQRREPGPLDSRFLALASLRLWQREGMVAFAWMAVGGVALLSMSAPLNLPAQAIFCATILAALLLLRAAGPAVDLAAVFLSGVLSARYFWWRASDSLDASRQLDLTLGLLLLLAEIWICLAAAKRAVGTGEHGGGPLPAAGFVTSLARMICVAAPAAVLVFDVRLIAAPAPLLALYALPHLLAGAFVSSRFALHAPGMARRGREIAQAWSVLQARNGTAPPVLAAWINLLAIGAGAAKLASGTADAEIIAVFLLWACFNAPVLAIAVSCGAATVLPDDDPPPSAVLAAALAGQRAMVAAVMRPLRRKATLFGEAIAWWLPRPPLQTLRLLGVALVTVAAALQTADLQARPQQKSERAAATALADAADGAQTRRVTMKELTLQNSLPLRTTDGSASVHFGSRADELVTRMKLVLRYSHSPALLPKDSHIKVILNGEMIGLAPIVRDADGQTLVREIDIDPRFIIDRNQLRFQFIGHYAATCEDPLRNSLWADVSGASELITSFTPLKLQNDLSQLPEPFFDHRDLRQVLVPFIFSAAPALPTLNAAGIVASWFGKLAGERGARFPSHLDAIPAGHGVVVATNSDRPAFLRGHAKVDGPAIEMVTNPADGRSKLLLVLGRDGNDIAAAAQALALGHVAMSGPLATINSRRDEAPRQAYDAPRWVRSDRPTRLGELIDYPQQLQSTGHAPLPLKLDLKIAPDIFSPADRGVPMSLRYRYSPPARAGESLLTLSVNDEMVQSYDLSPRPEGSALTARLARPDEALLAAERRLQIPTYKLKGQNRLQFAFAFARHQEGPCPDIPPDDTRRAMIDADSTIDLSGFHHFARMPNLNHFATVGFPFTKYADLSQTVVVLPDHPSVHEIESAMTMLGHFGRATGLSASRVRIAGPGEESLLENADLLVIGSALEQGVLANWGSHLPATVNGTVRRISQPARAINFFYDWLGFMADSDTTIMSQEKISAEGPLALMLGFQSPLTPGRSVIAITATAPDQLWQAISALGNPELARQIHGGASFIRGQKVVSMRVGDDYLIGDLPWWVTVWMPFSVHPLLLALLTIAAALLLAMVVWRIRLRRGENNA